MEDPADRIDRDVGLEDAYGLETPEDSRRLYRDWASTYDDTFIAKHGYTYHEAMAELFAERASANDQPILDLGCGTGAAGEALRRVGQWTVDGADISPEMMAIAAAKTDADGLSIYRHTLEVDLTQPLSLDDDSFGAIVSTGMFTHGHVGHEAFDELHRIARPGSLFAIGVNQEHFHQRGFAPRFDRDVADGRITTPELIPVRIYAEADSSTFEHAMDEALVVIFRTR